MSTENNLEDAVQSSIKAWLQETATHNINLSGYQIHGGQQDDTEELARPGIVIVAKREEEDPQPATGIWRMAVEVRLIAQADDTSTATLTQGWHDVLSALLWDNLAAELTTSTLGVYAVRWLGGTEQAVEGRAWERPINLVLWAYAK